MKTFNFLADILLHLIDINDSKCSKKSILSVTRRSLKYWKACGEKTFSAWFCLAEHIPHTNTDQNMM